MTTYNTGNPLGSTDPKDLYDNAQNLDTAINSPELTWVDRLGNLRPTFQGAVSDAITATELADPTGSSKIGHTPAGAGAVATTVEDQLRFIQESEVNVKDAPFYAVGDGVTNDTAALNAAKATGKTLFFPDGNYVVTGPFEMPLSFKGNLTITGDITWTQKNKAKQEGKLFVAGDVLMSGIYYSQFEYIDCIGFDFTIDGNSPVWGSFWNTFGFVRCDTLFFDVDQGQSVNQNTFETVRAGGGLHIKGVAVSGIREAHNNLIKNIDTTGANLTATDGTTGIHILNDSDLNQTNQIMNWYAESTGSRSIKGNWNVLGSTIDSSTGPILIDRKNSSLFAAQGLRNGSFLASSENVARGGDWGELTALGRPLSLSGASVSVVAVTDAPDGNGLALQQTGGVTFRSFDITYPLGTSGFVQATAYVYQEGTPSSLVDIIDNGGALVSSNHGSYTPLGNNWYLLRVAGPSAIGTVGQTGRIRIYTTTSGALTAADFRRIGSYFVTTEQTALLPKYKTGQKVGFGTTAPTAGNWLIGDIAWNTAPVAGGTPGWMCTASGTPGTWKAMANLAP